MRRLTEAEISDLKQNGCTAEDWNLIEVSEDFTAETFRHAHFYGTVKIGSQNGVVQLFGGITRRAGIYHAVIHHSEIGNNCFIHNVYNHLSNMEIADNVIIDNVQMIANDGECTFGNAEPIALLDETGGRQILMYDQLSAPLAYVMTLYRYRPKLISGLEKIIREYAKTKGSTKGFIGSNCTILNSGTIKNMWIGEHCHIEGARSMKSGSIISKKEAPVTIGSNVILKKFIIQSGSSVTDGVILNHCFVGQGCELSRNYSAENSVFFANCQGFHGEACSIFAGPYTVTHHKSTLLIAGMFSFLNAGSGSNQSNHMYKLGPIHQGVVERGSKTTSDSYLLWPAKIGPFTLVMGRHYKNSDTSDLPFSYLVERDDKSWLAPAVNLRSVGTVRDAMKWPKRDKRTDPQLLDSINFNLLSPYTIQKMEKAVSILKNLQSVTGESSDEFVYHNTIITQGSLKRGIELYAIGIDKFLGNSVITRLKKNPWKSLEDLRRLMAPDSETGSGEWIDLAGLIAPKDAVYQILDEVENGKLPDLLAIEAQFRSLHERYYDIEWNWSAGLLERRLRKKANELTIEDLIQLIERWKNSVVSLDKMLYSDAKKEFRLSAMTGFGADGDDKIRESDFEAVRGKFETNSFVKEIHSHIARKSALADSVIEALQKAAEA
jgi:acetyltransferase-like isoleucine patch superfamily enzyme